MFLGNTVLIPGRNRIPISPSTRVEQGELLFLPGLPASRTIQGFQLFRSPLVSFLTLMQAYLIYGPKLPQFDCCGCPETRLQKRLDTTTRVQVTPYTFDLATLRCKCCVTAADRVIIEPPADKKSEPCEIGPACKLLLAYKAREELGLHFSSLVCLPNES